MRAGGTVGIGENGFENGGRGHKVRDAGNLEAGKGKGTDSPLYPLKETLPVNTLILAQENSFGMVTAGRVR